MDTIGHQSLDLWGSIIHSFSIFLALFAGPNFGQVPAPKKLRVQSVRKSIKRQVHNLLSAILKFKILCKPQIIFERLRFTCEATKLNWCLPGFLALFCPVCNTGSFTVHLCVWAQCADPTPATIKDKDRTTFLESAEPDWWNLADSKVLVRALRWTWQSRENFTRGMAKAGVSFLPWHVTEKMTFKS